jgi:hypothetical protein
MPTVYNRSNDAIHRFIRLTSVAPWIGKSLRGSRFTLFPANRCCCCCAELVPMGCGYGDLRTGFHKKSSEDETGE